MYKKTKQNQKKINIKKGKYKYDQEVYDILMDSFDLMPLSCIVNGKFLAVHGGISPELRTVKKKKNIYIYI
jgi:serine/threonine-protein phosphatase 2B catalytic subunit